MIRSICHNLIKWYSSGNYQEFKKSLKNPKKTQLKILLELTGVKSYEEFKNNFPTTEYADWENVILDTREKNPEAHFVPTSGSTHKIKWVHYTKRFKAELWKASSAWIHDLYVRYPAIKSGTHYWSLSWLPQELRASQRNNDLDFFAGIEKYLLKQTMALDEVAANLPTLKDSMRESLVSLIEKNVTLISVWSPTFLLELLDQIISDKDFFLLSVTDKKKKMAIKAANAITPELVKILFPNLILISAWATSSSKIYADKLKEFFPSVSFESKGLWATEGVVTIPFEGQFPLAVNSHFYEFEELDTGIIYPAWDLKVGMKVTPILTTGSRFLRYKLNDIVLVNEMLEKTPCFEFLGRQNSTDLVGEKISSDLARKLIAEIKEQFHVDALSLLAVQGKKPHYRLLVEGLSKLETENEIAKVLENKLLAHFHYKLARELGQMDSVKVFMQKDAYQEYIKHKEKSIALKGNIKIEPLILVTEND